jgi:peroxiredoxin/outer membrane lipoprotein-sorting protein
MRKHAWMAFVLAAVLLWSCPVGAQEAASDAAEPEGQPQKPSVEYLIKQMEKTVRGITSVEIGANLNVEMKMGGQPMSQNMPIEFAYAQGPKLRLVMPDAQIFSDAETVTMYVPMFQRYSVEEYSEEALDEAFPAMQAVAELMAEPEEAPEDDVGSLLLPQFEKVFGKTAVAGSESIGETECWLMQAETTPGETEVMPAAVPIKAWFRKTDGAIMKVAADMTSFMKAQGQPGVEAVQFTLTVKTLKLNEPIGGKTFKFEPPPGAQKVEDLFDVGAMQEEEPQHPSVGKPAGEFEGQTLDGEPLKLADLLAEDKVVLLDFWASWCGPCMKELPELQDAWEQVEGEKVAFVGINRDFDREAAQSAVEKLGLTFPSVHDGRGEIAGMYNVQSIPTVVLIGPDGTVLERHGGYRPGIGKQLVQEILEALSPEPDAAE